MQLKIVWGAICVAHRFFKLQSEGKLTRNINKFLGQTKKNK